MNNRKASLTIHPALDLAIAQLCGDKDNPLRASNERHLLRFTLEEVIYALLEAPQPRTGGVVYPFRVEISAGAVGRRLEKEAEYCAIEDLLQRATSVADGEVSQ